MTFAEMIVEAISKGFLSRPAPEKGTLPKDGLNVCPDAQVVRVLDLLVEKGVLK